MTLSDLTPILEKEMIWAHGKHGEYHNAHEQYAVMLEEVEEWWLSVKGNYSDSCMYELVQVAAVALRYVMERGNIDRVAYVQQKRHELDACLKK